MEWREYIIKILSTLIQHEISGACGLIAYMLVRLSRHLYVNVKYGGAVYAFFQFGTLNALGT